MRGKTGLIAAALVVASVAAPFAASAQPGYLAAFNAKYGTAGSRLNTCKLCHTTPPSRNSYGNAVARVLNGGGSVGAALDRIKNLDSDKDGFTNIAEIKARTFPGRKSSHP